MSDECGTKLQGVKFGKELMNLLKKVLASAEGGVGEVRALDCRSDLSLYNTEFIEFAACQILYIIHIFEASLNVCDTDALLS
jgi:hypothetical protein